MRRGATADRSEALKPNVSDMLGRYPAVLFFESVSINLDFHGKNAGQMKASRIGEIMQEECEIVEADLECAEHQRDIRLLTAAYALDPMGNGGPLASDILERLIPGLKAHPTTLIFLAHDQRRAIGLATCFRGFSTFAALPIINISDLAVLHEYRGRGIARKLLDAVERKARALGCCKITLEVQENNKTARRIYALAGFSQAVYGPATGGSLYYWKPLES
jgi:GNAT superfamily N-acetyltransferase